MTGINTTDENTNDKGANLLSRDNGIGAALGANGVHEWGVVGGMR